MRQKKPSQRVHSKETRQDKTMVEDGQYMCKSRTTPRDWFKCTRPEHPAHGGVMLCTVQCRPASADLRRQEKVTLVREARARVDDAAAPGTARQTLLDALQDAKCTRQAAESIYREQFRFADHAVASAAQGFYPPRCSIRVRKGGMVITIPPLQRCKGASKSGDRCASPPRGCTLKKQDKTRQGRAIHV